MTTTTLPAVAPVEQRLRTVLRADAVATGAVGLLALVGPLSPYGDVPAWLPRTVGAALLLVALDIALASRWSGRRLRLAGTVTAELALTWVAVTAVVLATRDLPASGVELLALVGLATAAFGVAELRLVRALRDR